MEINNTDKTNQNLGINIFNGSKIIVDTRRLSHGLKTTFEGVAMVFGSLGAELEIEGIKKTIEPDSVQGVEKTEQFASSIHSGNDKSEDVEGEDLEESSKTSITLDDITRVIVAKVKQDKDTNSPRIEKLLQKYGTSKVSSLPVSKYEAFMAELASL